MVKFWGIEVQGQLGFGGGFGFGSGSGFRIGGAGRKFRTVAVMLQVW